MLRFLLLAGALGVAARARGVRGDVTCKTGLADASGNCVAQVRVFLGRADAVRVRPFHTRPPPPAMSALRAGVRSCASARCDRCVALRA